MSDELTKTSFGSAPEKREGGLWIRDPQSMKACDGMKIPVVADLCQTSLEDVLVLGAQNFFGRPLILLVTNDDRELAEQIVEPTDIQVVVLPTLEKCSWAVCFSHGKVIYSPGV